MNSARNLAILSASLLFVSLSARAVPIDIAFTGDNVVDDGGICDTMACWTGTGWGSLGTTSNLDDWQQADTVTLDLDPGTYWFAWYIENEGAGSSTNPGGFLAEIVFGDNVSSSSSDWEYSTDFRETWDAAITWGSNGGDNIWTNNLGGAINGISGDAQWLWSDINFNSDTSRRLWFRTSITVTEVPEPGTLALFGFGLLALAMLRRRRPAAIDG